MTVGVTAGWVERDGGIVPFQKKFPEAAMVVRRGVNEGLLEVANHGYTHCVLRDRLFRPRPFSGNRPYHREFHDWLPETMHREHIHRAQDILQDYLGAQVVTFVPPGNVFSAATLAAAAAAGLRYVSCLDSGRYGPVDGLTFVEEADVVAIHDRDIVRGGLGSFEDLVGGQRDRPFVTVREIGEKLEGARR